MRRLLTLALVAAAALVPLTAHAIPLDVKFVGTVQSQIDSGFALNSTVSGEFIYESTTASYTSFTIAGRSIGPSFTSSAAVTPDLFSDIFQAQISPVVQGGTLNSTFTLDLEGLNPWPSSDPFAVLAASVLAANLDKSLSTFGFYTGNTDGTGVHSLTASLSSVQAVPEPASLVLSLGGLAVLLVRARCRRSGRRAGAAHD